MNDITAFVDGSNIYGSDGERTKKLRTLADGLMKTHENFGVPNLPTRQQCGFLTPSPHKDDLVAGDARVIEQPALTAISTLFLAEHNRIARELKKELEKNNFLHSDDELIFQETRKIIGALLQKIVYKDYLPTILGTGAISANKLHFSGETEYDPNVDPSILNEFSTVAYRFGHSQIANVFDGNSSWPLKFHFFTRPTDRFVVGNEGKNWMDEMRGASAQKCPKTDLIIGDAVRKTLGGEADDLPARNIQRAREHGIPPYGVLREFCNLKPLEGNRKPEEIKKETWGKLLETYLENASEIDAFVGGLAEDAPEDGVVGPLFACIIGKQFQRLLFGDRYFFTHSAKNKARGLGKKTKESVLGRTLGDVICQNTHAEEIQPNVFKIPEVATNPVEPCEDADDLDFSAIAQEIIGNKTFLLQQGHGAWSRISSFLQQIP